MNQKYIGVALIVIGIISGLMVYGFRVREDNYIHYLVMAQGGSCYLDDGTCLHQDRDYSPYIVGWAMSIVLVVIGTYLIIFDRTQEMISKQSMEVATALKEAKKSSDQKEKFEAFLKGFSEDEQKILRAVKEQDGIKQSTLRFRTGLSKSTLSLVLKTLESRGYVSRKPAGKTNEVYLVNRF